MTPVTLASDPKDGVVQDEKIADALEPNKKTENDETVDEEEDEEEEEEVATIRNRFDLLLGPEDDADEDEAEDELEEEPVVEQPKVPQSKKKGKRRKKGRKKVAEVDDDDWDISGKPKDEEDLIDESLFLPDDDEELRATAAEIYKAICALHMERCKEAAAAEDAYRVKFEASKEFITVDPRLLSSDSELKKLFGARVVEAERRNEEMEQAAAMSGGRRRRRGATYGKRAGARKRWVLVHPREGWFSSMPGLHMVPDEAAPPSGSIRYFRYEHEGRYMRLQSDFHAAVLTHDANMIAELVMRHPYLVDGLLQLAEVHRTMGELERAGEYTERALHVLEASWHVAFRPYGSECRLRFEVPENQCFYLALVRYAQLLTRRGLHRTALECAKLTLAQDPSNDPVGALLVIDSLALHAGEYQWLINMCDSYKLVELTHFPNFALSRGLALVELQSKKKTRSNSGSAISTESAHEVLVDALLAFPDSLQPLLAATKDSGGSWSAHRLFNGNESGVLTRLGKIYAERAGLLWKTPYVKSALHRAAESAASIANDRQHRRLRKARQRRDLAEEFFLQTGMYRQLHVSDFSQGAPELNAELVAPDAAPQPMPMPVPMGAPRAGGGAAGGGGGAPIGVRQVGPVEAAREFLHSLLPWRDVQAAADDSDQRDRAAANGGEEQ